MNGIPQGWISTPFSELNYFWPKTINPSLFSGEIFELFSVPSFPNRKPELVRGEEIGSTKQIVEPGDVLVCKINPRINRVWQVTPKRQYQQIASSEWIVMRAPKLDSRYLTYYFTSTEFRRLLCADVSGIGGSLTRAQPSRVAKLPVKIAPLEEQRRIADKIDVLMAEVDSCRELLDRASLKLKEFRQSVLKSIITGKLTEDWREENFNPEYTSNLFTRLQQFSPYRRIERGDDDNEYILPESWLCVPIQAVGKVFLGRQRSPKHHVGANMRPYIRAANITWGGWDFSDVKEMNFELDDFTRYKLRVGDVLVNEGSGSADEVGKPAIWKGEIEK
jgi:type I restriction enzyme, S subunit